MKKVLNYVLLAVLLIIVLFVLTGCGTQNIEESVEDVKIESDIVEENEEEINIEDVSFDGVYVGKEEDNMEGLVIISDGPDKFVLIKDIQGSGHIRIGGENIVGNYMEKELMNEKFTITDSEENIKFTHPIFTLGEEALLTPATDEFCGIYKNEHNYLAIFKNFNGEMTVAYMETKFDNALTATMKDFTVTGNT